VIQTRHLVDFGAEIAEMIRRGGGGLFPVGSVNRVDRQELDAVVRMRPAGFVFVQSHHAVQKGMLSLAECLEVTRGAGVPTIVDAAAEEDLRRYIGAGADLVIYSGAKAFLGPTSGIVCGRRDLVAGVRAQEHGIGRAMKIGKESIAGLIRALTEYVSTDREATRAARGRMIQALLASFERIQGVVVARVPDEVRPDIERVQLRFEGEGGRARAHQLVDHLRTWRPSIRTRNHRVAEGIVGFDPRPVAESEIPIIIAAVEAFFGA